MLKEAGDELQDECNRKYPRGVTYGDIAVTGGGKLRCKEVYHVCCKTWNGEETRKVNATVHDNGHRREKTCLGGLRKTEAQTSLRIRAV